MIMYLEYNQTELQPTCIVKSLTNLHQYLIIHPPPMKWFTHTPSSQLVNTQDNN